MTGGTYNPSSVLYSAYASERSLISIKNITEISQLLLLFFLYVQHTLRVIRAASSVPICKKTAITYEIFISTAPSVTDGYGDHYLQNTQGGRRMIFCRYILRSAAQDEHVVTEKKLSFFCT